MSADWSLPTTGDSYSSILTELMSRDVDAITLCIVDPTNIPTNAFKYNRASDKFQEWSGSAWGDKVLSLAGGGTGGNTAANARTSLGLGSLALQAASAVAITGGTISGVTLNASVITAGTLALARGGTGASLSIGSSGAVLQSNGSAVVFGNDGSTLLNLNATQLTSGTIPAARIPSGLAYIRQVIQTNDATNAAVTTSSASYTEYTQMATVITPSTSASRIRLEISLNLLILNNSGGPAAIVAGVRLKRGTTVIKTWTCALGLNMANSSTVKGNIYLDYIDSPAVDTGITYHIEVNNVPAAGSISVNSDTGADSSFTLTELAA